MDAPAGRLRAVALHRPPVSTMLSTTLRDHLTRPRHCGRPAAYDATVRVEHPVCGDVVRVFARRGAQGVELHFEATACSAVIAFFSFALEHVAGWSPAALRTLDPRGLADRAGGLPPGKGHAATLVGEALRALFAAEEPA